LKKIFVRFPSRGVFDQRKRLKELMESGDGHFGMPGGVEEYADLFRPEWDAPLKGLGQ
jgi:hypothetical protein